MIAFAMMLIAVVGAAWLLVVFWTVVLALIVAYPMYTAAFALAIFLLWYFWWRHES